MSEADTRPPPSRGRSTIRGGRGGFGRGGPRGGRKNLNGTTTETIVVDDSLEDQGELGEMKKKYLTELSMLKELFPDWTDVDLVFALQEADGDVSSTVDKITQGNVSQFAEVKKTKDRARSKVKDEPGLMSTSDKPNSSGRGGRGRGGLESSRGGRGRGSERSRGRERGGRGGHATTNGSAKDGGSTSMPTNESTAWGNTSNVEVTGGSWDDSAAETLKPAGESVQGGWADGETSKSKVTAAPVSANPSLLPQSAPKKTWASMLKPAPAPVAKKIVQRPQPTQATEAEQVPRVAEGETMAFDKEALPPAAMTIARKLQTENREVSSGDEQLLTLPKDPLTEENVEHLPDESHPPATQTVASTAGSNNPRNLTPLPAQQASMSRPPLGGYATAANRLAGTGGRSASYQRRVQEQQEAVVMPGHNAVDRAAVQFGSMGLNGEPGLDVDEDREEAETRQPPQHSPPSQPRASLPPVPRQPSIPQEHGIAAETLTTPKQAPGLPPASAQNQQQIQEASLGQNLPPDSQINQVYNQYSRYGQPGMHQDSGMQHQKPYDLFNHQTQQTQYDQYGGHVQQHLQQQSQSGFSGLSSAANDYSSYYTSDAPRNAYNQYYGSSYGPQDARSQMLQSQQDAASGQQRSTSGFSAGQYESGSGSQTQQQVSITALTHLLRLYNSASEEKEKESLARKIDDLSLALQTAEQERYLRTSAAPESNIWEAGGSLSAFQNLGRPNSAGKDQHLPAVNSSASSPSHSTIHVEERITNWCVEQTQSRFSDAPGPGSGNNTPNPPMGGHQQPGNHPQQAQHSQQSMHHSHQQQGGYSGSAAAAAAAAGYPYGHPYYNSPYQQAYQTQFGYNHQVGGYGGGYPGKQGGMYGGPHGYGMGSQSSYDQQSSSPANTGGFGQIHQGSMRSASGMGSGIGGGFDEYGRGTNQSSSIQQNTGFGGMNDPFARSGSGFGAQGGYGQHGLAAGSEDALKPFGDAKNGPSPALGQPGRPGSAANSASGTGQSGLPPPQSHQSGFAGGYAGFPGQGSQYGGLGGLGNQQSGQGGMGSQGTYGSYGSSGFNQTYGNYGGSRGGWGQNYGVH